MILKSEIRFLDTDAQHGSNMREILITAQSLGLFSGDLAPAIKHQLTVQGLYMLLVNHIVESKVRWIWGCLSLEICCT